MKRSAIREGFVYADGKGVQRRVTSITCQWGWINVAWSKAGTDPRPPLHGTCLLETFARWARECVERPEIPITEVGLEDDDDG